MSEITTAIAAKQTQITKLQRDIETLERAASVLGGRSGTTARASTQPKAKRKRRKRRAAAKATPAQPRQRKRKPWSAASKRAMSRRIKAYWAKRRKAAG